MEQQVPETIPDDLSPTVSPTDALEGATGDDSFQGPLSKDALVETTIESEVNTRIEVNDSYPIDANFICNRCCSFHTDDFETFRQHIVDDEPVEWDAYLRQNPLHRCVGCNEPLDSVATTYCETCRGNRRKEIPDPDDRIPCQYCGKATVNVDDPFCSGPCAVNALSETDGPLSRPEAPSDDYLDGDYRCQDGVPSVAPLIETYQFVCRCCYDFGTDDLHSLSTHVGSTGCCESWANYVEQFRLNPCQTCGTPLRTLDTWYCDHSCQLSDNDPKRVCEGCQTVGADKGNRYCSLMCFIKHALHG